MTIKANISVNRGWQAFSSMQDTIKTTIKAPGQHLKEKQK